MNQAELADAFAALGDRTRLELAHKLSAAAPLSIARLAAGAGMTRQALTKHLRVLHKAGLIDRRKSGREQLYSLRPQSLTELQQQLATISRQWDDALARLKDYVEE